MLHSTSLFQTYFLQSWMGNICHGHSRAHNNGSVCSSQYITLNISHEWQRGSILVMKICQFFKQKSMLLCTKKLQYSVSSIFNLTLLLFQQMHKLFKTLHHHWGCKWKWKCKHVSTSVCHLQGSHDQIIVSCELVMASLTMANTHWNMLEQQTCNIKKLFK